jgi:hypothetical protein
LDEILVLKDSLQKQGVSGHLLLATKRGSLGKSRRDGALCKGLTKKKGRVRVSPAQLFRGT